MTRLKVHITTLPFNKDNLAFLEKSFDVTINPLGRKIKNEEVYEQVNKADYVIAGTEKYDQELLSKLVNLKGISRVGIGIDNIDLDSIVSNAVEEEFSRQRQIEYNKRPYMDLVIGNTNLNMRLKKRKNMII